MRYYISAILSFVIYSTGNFRSLLILTNDEKGKKGKGADDNA